MPGEQLLDVQPTELAFKVVPDAYSTKQLRLFNRGTQPMAFKIKTTNPKQYFVRPNQGVVSPGEKVVIHVMMGKVSEVPKEKCKDRFLVQSAPYDGPLPNDQFAWKQHFPDPNFKAEEIKLKCSYITSGGDETTTTTTTAAAAPATSDLRKRPNAAAPVASPVGAASKPPAAKAPAAASTPPKVTKAKGELHAEVTKAEAFLTKTKAAAGPPKSPPKKKEVVTPRKAAAATPKTKITPGSARKKDSPARGIFASADADKNGRLSSTELAAYCKENQAGSWSADYTRMLEQVSNKEFGEIDEENFVRLYDGLQIFEEVTSKGASSIVKEHLQTYVKNHQGSLGKKLEDFNFAEFWTGLERFDENKDGEIQYEEFLQWYTFGENQEFLNVMAKQDRNSGKRPDTRQPGIKMRTTELDGKGGVKI